MLPQEENCILHPTFAMENTMPPPHRQGVPPRFVVVIATTLHGPVVLPCHACPCNMQNKKSWHRSWALQWLQIHVITHLLTHVLRVEEVCLNKRMLATVVVHFCMQ